MRISQLKIPRTLPAMADAFYQARQHRYTLQLDIAKLKSFESDLRNNIVASGQLTVTGQLAKVSVVPKQGVKVTDRDALHEYIRRHSAFNLLLREVNEEEFRKLWAEGKEVPGTEPGSYFEVSAVKL